MQIVTVTLENQNGNWVISATPDPLRIITDKKKAEHIRWVIKHSDNAKFSDNGIDIKNDEKDFVGKEAKGGMFQMLLKKPRLESGQHRKYKYDINVICPDGKTCTLDPTIVNEGDTEAEYDPRA